MVDSDIHIPEAYGTLVPPTAPPAARLRPDLRTSQHVNGGSSRVMLPVNRDDRPQLSDSTLTELQAQGYTRGLAEALIKNKIAFPISIWVVDNSGSMSEKDGHRLVETAKKNEVKLVDCTRWAEMQQTVDYHAQMAAMLKNPTVFRMLNDPGRASGPQQFSIAERGDQYIDEDLAIAQSTMMNSSPGGVTPLISHLQDIRSNILAMESSLRQDGTKVVLVLATDGLPTDERGMCDDGLKQRFVATLRSFEGLPVWVVVRLCTDDDEVVKYWNNLDGQLELSLEVLDDFTSEALEVHENNKWLNYGLPLHRMREMGFHDRLFDLLDERQLSKDELRDFFRILFGNNTMDGVPDPEADWKGFLASTTRLVDSEKNTWNPVTRRMAPWVDMKRLRKDYGSGFSFW
jgi:hypothetical protein